MFHENDESGEIQLPKYAVPITFLTMIGIGSVLVCLVLILVINLFKPAKTRADQSDSPVLNLAVPVSLIQKVQKVKFGDVAIQNQMQHFAAVVNDGRMEISRRTVS